MSEKNIPKAYESKMVIVVRKDILDITGKDPTKMDAGKLVAQVSHGVLGIYLDMMRGCEYKDYIAPNEDYTLSMEVKKGSANALWLENGFAKVMLSAKNEGQFLKHYEMIKEAGYKVTMITDRGNTVFEGVATNTVFAVEPAFKEDIDKLTKRLQLLKLKVDCEKKIK